MKHVIILTALLFITYCGYAESGRIYTIPDVTSPAGILGRTEAELTHAIAVDHERLHAYLGELSDAGRAFSFQHLPVGKFDLVLITRDGSVYEGVSLGNPPDAIAAGPLKNLQTRIALADAFFNRHLVHRTGVDGDRAFAFVERIRDKLILKQSGEKLDANLRRLEIIELEQAGDDWQMVSTRHIYREDEPLVENPPFFKHFFFSGLGNIRIVDSVKDLGLLVLPKN